MTLPQSTLDRLEKDAEKYATNGSYHILRWTEKGGLFNPVAYTHFLKGTTAEAHRSAELVKALENISVQKTTKENEAADNEGGDYEFGYDEIIRVAREALNNYNKA